MPLTEGAIAVRFQAVPGERIRWLLPDVPAASFSREVNQGLFPRTMASGMLPDLMAHHVPAGDVSGYAPEVAYVM